MNLKSLYCYEEIEQRWWNEEWEKKFGNHYDVDGMCRDLGTFSSKLMLNTILSLNQK